MIKLDGCKYIPDFESRYFQEGFNYSLKCIYDVAKNSNIEIPTIEKIYLWKKIF